MMNILISVPMECPFCGRIHTVEADYNGLMAWQEGMLIQQALPTLTNVEREQLISNMCPDCQQTFFDEDEEESISIEVLFI